MAARSTRTSCAGSDSASWGTAPWAGSWRRARGRSGWRCGRRSGPRSSCPASRSTVCCPPTDLRELLSASDVVVLCASLNRSTRHLIGEAELAAMKPTAVLVNVARGGLVDEDALVRALRDGGLRGAMLDVTREEPLPRGEPALGRRRTCSSPPTSAGTRRRAGGGASSSSARNLGLYLDGAPDRMGNLVDYDAVL